MDAVIYIHGKGGSAAEADRFAPIFPDRFVFGLNFKTFTPWETGKEIKGAVSDLKKKYGDVILIANSIGAYFSMNAGIERDISHAFFISPLTDMERLIRSMMTSAHVSEAELEKRGVISTGTGEDLSWVYFKYATDHPVVWRVGTDILYGENDALIPLDEIRSFAKKTGSTLTVMRGGEHWFHTDEQMRFLDAWIAGKAKDIFTRGIR